MVTKHEKTRQKLWIKAWTATVSNTNCLDSSTPTRYADRALEAFDERFTEKIEVADPPLRDTNTYLERAKLHEK